MAMERALEPAGAITLARTCSKTSANGPSGAADWQEADDLLPSTQFHKVLKLAPDANTEQVFKQIGKASLSSSPGALAQV